MFDSTNLVPPIVQVGEIEPVNKSNVTVSTVPSTGFPFWTLKDKDNVLLLSEPVPVYLTLILPFDNC